MLLREGATAKSACDELRSAIGRVEGGVTGDAHLAYVRLIDELEGQLGNAFDRSAVLGLLHTTRCWYILGNQPSAAEKNKIYALNSAINQEREFLKASFKALEAQFIGLATWLARPGQLAILDTNILMHCAPINTINWAKTLNAPGGAARLVVPLAVVDELDRKKFEGGDKMRERASKAIAQLHRLREGVAVDDPAIVRGPGGTTATLEIPRDNVGRVRMAGTDDELIDFGGFLSRAGGGRRVVMVTRDLGAQIRAERSGLSVVWLPDEHAKDVAVVASVPTEAMVGESGRAAE